MELDELKYQLKNRLSGESDKSAGDLGLMLHSKTKSAVSKLKRSLWIELGCAILFTLVFAGIGLFTRYWSLRVYFGVFSVVFALFTFIIGYLIKRANELSSAESTIKTNLLQLVKIMQEYVKRSFQFTMALLPVCFLFSFWLGYNEPAHFKPQMTNPFFHIVKNKAPVYIFLVIYFVGLSIGLYYFTKWYLKKLYGNYIQQLKQHLGELDED
jgi:hypothetical protein